MGDMKRFIFLILAVLMLCAVFHMELIGSGLQIFLRSRGIELSYKSLYWSNGELVGEDLILQHENGKAVVERAAFLPDWSSFPRRLKGDLNIESPSLSIDKMPQFSPGADWIDLKISIERGKVDWGGQVEFSFYSHDQIAHLALDWEDSNLKILKKIDQYEAEFHRFNGALLTPFLPVGELKKGFLSGRIAMDEKGELFAANLKVEELSGSLLPALIQQGEGTFSYNANSGAKWEMKGTGMAQGKEFPFLVQGKGFFNSHWMESEIQFPNGVCKLFGDEAWRVECESLFSEHVAFIQAGVAAVWPEIGEWAITSGSLSGKGSFSQEGWSVQFEGAHLGVQKGEFTFLADLAIGDLTQDGGSLIVTSPDIDFKAAGVWDDWSSDLRLGSSFLTLRGGWDGKTVPIQIEKGIANGLEFSGKGWIDPHFDFGFSFKGKWVAAQKELPIYCPNFSKQGSIWSFDVRCPRATWDLLRISGSFDGKEVLFSNFSHFLGTPLTFHPTNLGELDMETLLSPSAISSLGPLLKEWGLDLTDFPLLGPLGIHFKYMNHQANLLAKGPSFQFSLEQVETGWQIDLESLLTLHALLKKDGCVKGSGRFQSDAFVEFDGKIDPSFRCEFALPKVEFDLKLAGEDKIAGRVEGQGHLIYDHRIEADFDLTAQSLKLHSYPLENEGIIHFSYSSLTGALFKGINLHGEFDCMVDLLEYDACRSHWVFHGAQVHMPALFLKGELFEFLDKKRDLNFKADLDFASDFSTFVCTMEEGFIPYKGSDLPIQKFHLVWENGECRAALNLWDHLHRIQFRRDEEISGRVFMGQEETPLCIEWSYRNGLGIHSIEGSFAGIEASFHEEMPNQLIGSARINFIELSKIVPVAVAEGFAKIKLGKGYEVKGRLKIEEKGPHFEGILCGKQIELFGFQFRTLLGQVDYSLDRVRIFDTHISDTAGIMKIDEILMQTIDKKPWTLTIPTITVKEFRPSLLLRPEGTVGPISPLVVREMTLTDFHGLLDEGKTYKAQGELHFINSYKRGETVFDLPANVLSRIVGLDLELLIPVCGDLTFHLADGHFTLDELKNAFSEGKRSEFFLEMNPPPFMDLDGNLEIFIKMKQFVLLKFTESFLISIEGQLQDPKYHLQKRRFFGLL
jgi:hypothetical protein